MTTSLNIEKMTCSYNENVVLECNNINLNVSDICFVVGKSGMGKSTFLEAIGLMTNTMTNDSLVSIKNGETNLKSLWNESDKKRSEFRQKHFSFIFQNTNLMPNFTAGENMSFGSMVSGLNFQNAKKSVLKLMKDIDLEKEVFDKNTQLLSGGQRQRLAFVRAITAEYDILFGDEPTGNLDEILASKLMNILKSQIKDSQKTAIIVSHDINLALKYANIILIVESIYEPHLHGLISPEVSLVKKDGIWTTLRGGRLLDVRKYLNEHMK